MTNRLAELHAEIDARDRKIDELERQLKAKDLIIRRQGVIIARLENEDTAAENS